MSSHWLGSIAARARGEQREEEELMKEGRDLVVGGVGGVWGGGGGV